MLLLVLLLTLQGDPALQTRFMELEHRLVSGLQEKNSERLDSLLAPDYVLRGRPDIDRATWIRNAVSLCWGDRADIAEFTAREAGGAVITSFVLTMYQDPATCKRATVRSLITDVWSRKNDQWLLTMRHSGPIGGAGQDPLAQQFRREEPPPPRWESSSELSFVSTGGNSRIQTLGAGGQLIFRPGKWETQARAAFVRSVADGLESARSITAQLREAAQLHPRVDLFGRSDYRRDLFAGIEHRYGLDGGIGLKILQKDSHRLKFDLGFGYLVEERSIGSRIRSATFSAVKTWQWKIWPQVTIANDAAAVMLLQQTSAWRFNNQLSMTTDLTGLFSLKVSHTLSYLNRPVTGFGSTDTIVSAALVARFSKP